MENVFQKKLFNSQENIQEDISSLHSFCEWIYNTVGVLTIIKWINKVLQVDILDTIWDKNRERKNKQNYFFLISIHKYNSIK